MSIHQAACRAVVYNNFMNDDIIQDLKQFITTTVSQTERRLGGRMDNLEQKFDNLERKVDNLELKVDQGFADVAELIDTRVEPVEQEVADHGQRITKLESAKV